MDEQMAAWMEFASPVAQHEFLKKLEGNWKAKVQMWMKPGTPPMESQGKMVNEMILGGRYLRSTFESSSAMGEFGGLALDAYDRMGQKYKGIWIDSMGTGMMVFEGTADGNVRTMTCDSIGPDGKAFKTKGVTTIVSENEHLYASYIQSAEGKFKNMEIVYTR